MVDHERPRLGRFRERLAELIPCDPEDARADLHKMGPHELLRCYVNWADRHVAPRPRRVVTWDGFLRHGSAQRHLDAVRELAKKIEAGLDLTPFLSEDIDRFGYIRPKVSKKRGAIQWEPVKDYALNAFETHHLHLSTHIRADGWSKRTDELLYVIFSRDNAFLVMVGDHHSFDDGTLAQAIAEARVGTSLELKGVLGPALARTMREHNQPQRRGLSTAYQAGEQMVLGAFLSMSGISPLHSRHVDCVIDFMSATDPQIDIPGFGREWFERNGWEYPTTPTFEWSMRYCDLWLDETSTGKGFLMSPVKWRR
jgi:hypothetical protein